MVFVCLLLCRKCFELVTICSWFIRHLYGCNHVGSRCDSRLQENQAAVLWFQACFHSEVNPVLFVVNLLIDFSIVTVSKTGYLFEWAACLVKSINKGNCICHIDVEFKHLAFCLIWIDLYLYCLTKNYGADWWMNYEHTIHKIVRALLS